MFGAIAGGIASALAGGAMSKLFGGGQKAASGGIQGDRSEERRVGKECRSRGAPYQLKKKPASTHAPAWRGFNRLICADGSVCDWHETSVLQADRSDAIHAQ